MRTAAYTVSLTDPVLSPVPAGSYRGSSRRDRSGLLRQRLWVSATDQATGNKWFPAALGLGQSIGYQMQHSRVVPESKMATEYLDVLAMLARAEAAGLPRHNPIAAGVHRGRGHAQ